MRIENCDNSTNENPALIYAAIKLIENLAMQGKVSHQVYQSILNDYRGTFELSQSGCYPETSAKCDQFSKGGLIDVRI